jgi:hypothetical protein
MQKPAKLNLPGCKTRFDELQAVHQLQAYATHHVVRLAHMFIFLLIELSRAPSSPSIASFLEPTKKPSDQNADTLATNRTSLFLQPRRHSPPTLILTSSHSYWQEQLDAGKFSSSIIFSPTTGFGGDGSGRGNCITTGPFANYTNHLGPGYQITDHCIDRKISNSISAGSSQAEVNKCLAMGTFAQAWPCIEAQPHGGGHAGVGAQVSATFSKCCAEWM